MRCFTILSLAPLASITSAGILIMPGTLFPKVPPESKLTIKVTDERIDYGTQNPGQIIASVRDNCHTTSCPVDWKIPTTFLHKSGLDGAGTGKPALLKITAIDAALNNKENFEPMLDAIVRFMDRPEITKYQVLVANTRDAPCKRAAADDGRVRVENWQGPASVELIISENKASSNNIKDHLRLGFEIVQEEKAPWAAGLCGAANGLAGAIAGAANPYAGVVMAFGGFVCMPL